MAAACWMSAPPTGSFPFEAIERGAARALGLEPNPKTFAVAERIAALHGGRWEVRNEPG